jgi:hypothetical protein
MLFSQAYPGTAAVLVDEFDACFFEGTSDFLSCSFPTAEYPLGRLQPLYRWEGDASGRC